MWTTKRLTKRYGGPVCRHCVNDTMDVHLYPKDCRYLRERGVCARCGKDDKHLVAGFRLSGKWKLKGK